MRIEYPKNKGVKEIWEEDQLAEEIENKLFERGLVKKITLVNHLSPGVDKIYDKRILYSNEEQSKGILLSLQSLGSLQTMRKDYLVYSIGEDKELEGEIREIILEN